MILVDDHLLLDVLVTRRSRSLLAARSRGDLATTGLWYYRLCHAIGSSSIAGRLSAPLASLPEPTREDAIRAIVRLPEDIVVVSLRDLAPAMARVVSHHRLNLLAQEAVAAARHLNAEVRVSKHDDGPLLRVALRAEGIHLTAQ